MTEDQYSIEGKIDSKWKINLSKYVKNKETKRRKIAKACRKQQQGESENVGLRGNGSQLMYENKAALESQ